MRVLVTGSAGLVGNALCTYFLKQKVNVCGITNTTTVHIDEPGFSVLRLDLTKEKIEFDLSVDAVIHCSALIPGGKNKESDDELYKRNQQIDQTVFSFCKQKKVKLIFFSTAFMYDLFSGKVNEHTPVRSDLTGYYKSKKHSEDFLVNSEMDYIILRLASPYGNLEKQNNVMKVFSEKIKHNLPVSLIGNGSRMQNFIYTEDIADACFRGLSSGANGIYNLTYDRPYSMLQLAEYLREIYNSDSSILFDKTVVDAETNVDFDNSKIKQQFNWAPKTDLKSGLKKTLIH